MFPQQAGNLSVPAVDATVRSFRSFAARRVRSQEISIEVLALPAQGRPASFSANNVGSYGISAEVDHTSLAVGQPFTLTVTVEGVGNIDLIDPGAWPQVEGVRRYDPKVETISSIEEGRVGGKRIYKFLMIPEQEGALQFPPHELAFFDPEEGAYKTARTEPITIQVGEGDAVEPIRATEIAEDHTELAPIVISDHVSREPIASRWLTPRRWLYAMLAVPALAGFTGVAGALWRRFGEDEHIRARAQARARRRALIEAARKSADSGEGFHAAVGQLLHELAVERAGSQAIGAPRPELMRQLASAGVTEDDRVVLERLLSRCDEARFGAHRVEQGDRQTLLSEALELVRSSSLTKEVR
jgi:hypothetical protein